MTDSAEKSLQELLTDVQRGHTGAYEDVVERFQDMAVGYAYAILGDIHLAEDAAQEAFIAAFYSLPDLRSQAAFPGWFRRIVFSQASRLCRRKQLPLVSLEQISEIGLAQTGPTAVIEQREVQTLVADAIAGLPEHQRVVVNLFYIGDYSQKEISAFLEIPVATVKTRLHAARKRLKRSMIVHLRDYLWEHRPSKNETFLQEIKMDLTLAIVESIGASGCRVRLIENDEPLDTRYSLQIQDQIKIRPTQLVVVDRQPSPARTVYRLFRSQIKDVIDDQLTVEQMRDEGDRGKGKLAQAVLAEGLHLNIQEGDDVYGREVIFGLVADNRPADPEQLLATLSPIVRTIYEGDAFQLDPDSAPGHTNQGNVHLDAGEFDAAISAYDRALAVNPNYLVAYVNRGYAFKGKGDRVQAREDWLKAEDLLENPTPDILPDNHPTWHPAEKALENKKVIETRLRRVRKQLAILEDD